MPQADDEDDEDEFGGDISDDGSASALDDVY